MTELWGDTFSEKGDAPMCSKFHPAFDARDRSEQGQTLSEYAMILALIAIVSLLAIGALGVVIGANFGEITAAL